MYLQNNLLNTENGKIIFVSSTAGQWAFRGCNKQVKNKLEDISQNGTKSNIDDLMETFATAVNSDKNNPKSGNYQFPKSAYGMSKVCAITTAMIMLCYL